MKNLYLNPFSAIVQSFEKQLFWHSSSTISNWQKFGYIWHVKPLNFWNAQLTLFQVYSEIPGVVSKNDRKIALFLTRHIINLN